MTTAAILLRRGFIGLGHRKISISLTSWNLGFSALTPYTYVVNDLPREDPAGFITNVLANLPQLLLSFINIIYNVILSAFLVQRKFSHMHLVRKPSAFQSRRVSSGSVI